jgi:hypothetical protein
VEGQILGSFVTLLSDKLDSFKLSEAVFGNSDGG